MTDSKCEDLSLCENFPIAICLHCNLRLCLRHIGEHDRVVFNDFRSLSKLAEETLQQIKDKSEKSRIACDNLLPTLDEWRTQQLEKIEQIYENELELIGFQEESLERFHKHLLEQIERDARQPLECIQRQQNVNTEVFTFIRETIEKVRQETTHLKWEFSTPSSDYTKYSPSEFAPIQIPTIAKDDIKLIENQRTTNKKLSSIRSTNNIEKRSKGHPLKRVFKMFSDISSIRQSRIDIDTYIKKQRHHFKLLILISSYLKAWHKKSNASEKSFLLNEHISTIQKYLGNCKSDFDVLLAIQTFFYNNSFQDKKGKIMTFLLQFFLNHRCITQNLIIAWYNGNDIYGYVGFQEAKQLVEPFFLLVNDTQAAST